MKILLIEDNKVYAAQLMELIQSLSPVPAIDWVESRNSAQGFLNRNFYDAIILDLSIPTADGGFDLDAAHGESVFHHARSVSPGTPVYILTGSEPGAFLRALARHGQSIDIWGGGNSTPTVDYYSKEDGIQLLEVLKNINAIIQATDSIKINTGGQNLGLTLEQERALKVFTRSNGGTYCNVKRLGGLSDALVLKVSVRNNLGVRCECVAKLGLAKHITKEIQAYNEEVKHLRLGAFAPVLSHHDQGLRGFSSIFYTMADDYKYTFFDFVSSNQNKISAVVKETREALRRWSDSSQIKTVKVKEIRRRVISDERFEEIVDKYGLSHLIPHQEKTVDISVSCIHGDLHGGNILVNDDSKPVLIDFGDVGHGFSCLDPIALELSLYFHPDAIENGLAEKVDSHVESWANLEKYTAGNPLKDIIKSCREWAYDTGPHDDSVLTMAYYYVLRQLKYDTVPADKTLRLLNSIWLSIKGSSA